MTLAAILQDLGGALSEPELWAINYECMKTLSALHFNKLRKFIMFNTDYSIYAIRS